MGKKKKNPVKEVDVARRLVKWLIEQGWEVYQEVPISYNRVVDIIAIKRDPKIAWLIEVKVGINGRLYWQAKDALTHSPHVSVALAYPRRLTKARKEFIELMRKYGIGFIHIYENGTIDVIAEFNAEIESDERSYWMRYRPERYDGLFDLHEQYKTFCPAGSAGGGYLTPYKMTCMNIVDYVKEHPGCSVSEAVKNVQHHYSSYNSALSALGQHGIRGIEFRTCLFVKEDK